MAEKPVIPTLKQILKRFVMLVVAMFVYLLLGALSFQKLESDHNIAAQRRFLQAANEFLIEHPCLAENDTLVEFLDEVEEAIGMSVISITRSSYVREAGRLWDLPTSFFFSFTVVSTIGYGNFAPTTDAGRMVCTFYALIGISLTGWFVLTVGDALQGWWQRMRRVTHRLTARLPWPRIRHVIHFILYACIITIVLVVIPGVIFSYTEDWSVGDSIYFCFISISTIGFGDQVAGDRPLRGERTRWLEVLVMVMWLLFGLTIMATGLKAMANSQKRNVLRAGSAMRTFVRKAGIKKSHRALPSSTRSAEFYTTPSGLPKNRSTRSV